MKVEKTRIEGCYLVEPNKQEDERGKFIKTYHHDEFARLGLQNKFTEQYYSYSYNGVLRGLHFQTPPFDHDKLVFCLAGDVLDVVVDLRKGSPTFGKYELFDLNEQNQRMVYLPSGMAHGFYVRSEIAIMSYNVTSVYSREHDSGIKWDSVGIPWPNKNPKLSNRDMNLSNFWEYESPFKYND
jgi:dTDP-4-dehydrorhamnose 3,5-epimerase